MSVKSRPEGRSNESGPVVKSMPPASQSSLNSISRCSRIGRPSKSPRDAPSRRVNAEAVAAASSAGRGGAWAGPVRGAGRSPARGRRRSPGRPRRSVGAAAAGRARSGPTGPGSPVDTRPGTSAWCHEPPRPRAITRPASVAIRAASDLYYGVGRVGRTNGSGSAPVIFKTSTTALN